MQQLWSASFWCACSFFGSVKILKSASDLKCRGMRVWWWRRKWACCLCNLNFRRANLFLCPSLGDRGRGEKRTTSLLVPCLLPIHLSWIFPICPPDPLSIPMHLFSESRHWMQWTTSVGPAVPALGRSGGGGERGVLAVPPAPCLWGQGCLPWTGRLR